MKTSDITLTTTLSLWFPIEGIERLQNSKKVYFLFKESKQLDELIEKYWNKELRVEPRAFFDQLRANKGRVYDNS